HQNLDKRIACGSERTLQPFVVKLQLTLSLHRLIMLKRPLYRSRQVLIDPRLCNVFIDDAGIYSLDKSARIGIASQHYPHGLTPHLRGSLEKLDAGHPRHSLVGYDHGNVVDLEQFERLGTARGSVNVVGV